MQQFSFVLQLFMQIMYAMLSEPYPQCVFTNCRSVQIVYYAYATV